MATKYQIEMDKNYQILDTYFSNNKFDEQMSKLPSYKSANIFRLSHLILDVHAIQPIKEIQINLSNNTTFFRPYFSNNDLQKISEKNRQNGLLYEFFNKPSLTGGPLSTAVKILSFFTKIYCFPSDFFDSKAMINLIHNFFHNNNRTFSFLQKINLNNSSPKRAHSSNLSQNNSFQIQAIELIKLIAKKDIHHILNPILNIHFLVDIGINIFHKQMDEELFNILVKNTIIFSKGYSKKKEYPFIMSLSSYIKTYDSIISFNKNYQRDDTFLNAFTQHPLIKPQLNREFSSLLENKNTNITTSVNNILYFTYFSSPEVRDSIRQYLYQEQPAYYKEFFNYKTVYSDQTLSKNFPVKHISDYPPDYFKINIYNKPNFIATILMLCETNNCTKILSHNPLVCRYILTQFKYQPVYSNLDFLNLIKKHQKILNPKLFNSFSQTSFYAKMNLTHDFLQTQVDDYRVNKLNEKFDYIKKDTTTHTKRKL